MSFGMGTKPKKRDAAPDAARPWLLSLAQAQVARPSPTGQVYDRRTQMTRLQAPGCGAVIDSDEAPTTKKADRETGEDQKGF